MKPSMHYKELPCLDVSDSSDCFTLQLLVLCSSGVATSSFLGSAHVLIHVPAHRSHYDA
ncbi:hypothetical protein EXN66_Car006522 [Channa argus]|uniref:Uncharacterized protein n=1 Tax=Channa argus TaxID=215402 RepID=A0A6G1PLJ3_CHAAH|nr:hypothetical protein EXN66_Car006522 [Channa argus]